MSVYQRHPVSDLPEWLGIATKDLVAPAKERIQSEIESHYAEASAAHLVAGLSESNARKEALAELGDAQEAAKRFRKQHLTVNEAEKIERDFVWNVWQLLGTYLFCFFMLALFLLPLFTFHDKSGFRGDIVNSAGYFWILGINSTVKFIMGRRKSKNLCFFYMTEIIVLILLSFLAYFMNGFFNNSFWALSNISIICLLFIVSYLNLRIALKLRHVPNFWDEIPIQNE
jgi:hypothetical protein